MILKNKTEILNKNLKIFTDQTQMQVKAELQEKRQMVKQKLLDASIANQLWLKKLNFVTLS